MCKLIALQHIKPEGEIPCFGGLRRIPPSCTTIGTLDKVRKPAKGELSERELEMYSKLWRKTYYIATYTVLRNILTSTYISILLRVSVLRHLFSSQLYTYSIKVSRHSIFF